MVVPVEFAVPGPDSTHLAKYPGLWVAIVPMLPRDIQPWAWAELHWQTAHARQVENCVA